MTGQIRPAREREELQEPYVVFVQIHKSSFCPNLCYVPFPGYTSRPNRENCEACPNRKAFKAILRLVCAFSFYLQPECSVSSRTLRWDKRSKKDEEDHSGTGADEDTENFEDETQPSNLGSHLSQLITKRVIVGVLTMVHYLSMSLTFHCLCHSLFVTE